MHRSAHDCRQMQSDRQDLGHHLVFELTENTRVDPEPFCESAPMTTVLLINPNTSAGVTELMSTLVAPLLDAPLELVALTARFGASYISSEVSYAIAAHALLDAWAAHRAAGGPCDAVLVGCFGDPGVAALREIAGVPVIGLAEASLREAAAYGRYAIVTGGLAWGPMLRRFAAAHGLDRDLAGVQVLERSGAELMADPQAAERDLLAALREAATDGVGALVLGGAALGGIAARLGSHLPVPVIDSVQAGARAVNQALRASGVLNAELTPSAKADTAAWGGLSGELLAALSRGLDPFATAHPSRPRGG